MKTTKSTVKNQTSKLPAVKPTKKSGVKGGKKVKGSC
jgi:hypothetical protein